MSAYRLIDAQYDGHCANCDGKIDVGDEIWWAPGEPVYCAECPPDDLEPPPVGGTAATTAQERETGEERTKRVAAERTAKDASDLAGLRLKVNDLGKLLDETRHLVEHLYAQLGESPPEA